MPEGVSIAIVIGIIIVVSVAVALCTFYLTWCYHKRISCTNHRVVVVAQQTPRRVYTRAPTITDDDTAYNEAPPAYIPDSGYQPFPAKAPPLAEDSDH